MERRSCGGTTDLSGEMSREMIGAGLSRYEIEQPAGAAHEHLASGRRHRRYTVNNGNEAELDEAFDEIGLRETTVRRRVAKCAQRFPLVRRKFEVEIVAHVASSDRAVRASVSDAA